MCKALSQIGAVMTPVMDGSVPGLAAIGITTPSELIAALDQVESNIGIVQAALPRSLRRAGDEKLAGQVEANVTPLRRDSDMQHLVVSLAGSDWTQMVALSTPELNEWTAKTCPRA